MQRGSRGGGDGVWLPDTLAAAADVAPGDRVALVGVDADDGTAVEVTAPVAGTYRDPFDEGLLRADAPEVWRDVLDGVPRVATHAPDLLAVVDRVVRLADGRDVG